MGDSRGGGWGGACDLVFGMAPENTASTYVRGCSGGGKDDKKKEMVGVCVSNKHVGQGGVWEWKKVGQGGQVGCQVCRTNYRSRRWLAVYVFTEQHGIAWRGC